MKQTLLVGFIFHCLVLTGITDLTLYLCSFFSSRDHVPKTVSFNFKFCKQRSLMLTHHVSPVLATLRKYSSSNAGTSSVGFLLYSEKESQSIFCLCIHEIMLMISGEQGHQ